MIDFIALIIKLIGIAFLLIATVGLLRFQDVFQRMHAATKAGTLGAGLVLLGTVINKGTFDAAMTGTLSLLFLILTIPVASHILARAAYMSGSHLQLGDGPDALSGTLQRTSEPLETFIEDRGYDVERAARKLEDAALGVGSVYPLQTMKDGSQSLKQMIAPERVRFAAIGRSAPALGRRAAEFARRTDLPLTAVVAIDTRYADATAKSSETLRLMRDEVGTWLPDLKSLAETSGVPVDLVYEEGDAEALMAGVGDEKEFLVLPIKGWADHDIGVRTDYATREPDSLLRITGLHPGPVMYAVDDARSGAVAVAFDGSFNVWRGLDLALVEELWDATELRVYADVDAESRSEIEARCRTAGIPVSFVSPASMPTGEAMLPSAMMEGVVGVIIPDLPRPLRINWYGNFWQDRIAKGWRGDVLVWT